MITKEQFASIVLQKDLTESFYLPLTIACDNYEINTQVRIAAFLSQVMHECMDLRVLSENLNYSASGLLKTFPKYFTPQQAEAYKRDPKRIANRVYANRMGNGDEQSGDGWKYRGRGCIQLTGHDNYKAFSEAIGFDFVLHPDWLTLEKYAMAAAGWYWNERQINEVAADVTAATKLVNGGINGLADREMRYKKYLAILSK